MKILGILIGFVLGTLFGVMIMCLMSFTKED